MTKPVCETSSTTFFYNLTFLKLKGFDIFVIYQVKLALVGMIKFALLFVEKCSVIQDYILAFYYTSNVPLLYYQIKEF